MSPDLWHTEFWQQTKSEKKSISMCSINWIESHYLFAFWSYLVSWSCPIWHNQYIINLVAIWYWVLPCAPITSTLVQNCVIANLTCCELWFISWLFSRTRSIATVIFLIEYYGGISKLLTRGHNKQSVVAREQIFNF